MVRTQIQLTESQFEKIKEISGKSRLSMAEIIRQGMDAYLGGQIGASSAEIRARARAISGKYASGKRDLSDKHDAYLAEAFK
jgi:hypothetical protein